MTNEGEAEWKDGGSKRKAMSIGDQILEMQAKKLKAEWWVRLGVSCSEASKQIEANKDAVDAERQHMLFRLNVEQYTCVLRQQAITLYVQERVGQPVKTEA